MKMLSEKEQEMLVNELLLQFLMGFGYVNPEKKMKKTADKVKKTAKNSFSSNDYLAMSEFSERYKIPTRTLYHFMKKNSIKKTKSGKNFYSLTDFIKKSNKLGFVERYQ